ncbi:MAG: HlyD family secretion protein, partial [Polyangia bacterium]
KVILGGVALTLAIGGTAYWLYSRQFEDTDDAQIDGNISNLSTRVSGTVKAVHVEENAPVKVGEVLVELDPTDLEVALLQAKASVAQAQAQLQAEDPSVSIAQSANKASISSASADVMTAAAGISGAKNDVLQIQAQLEQAQANDKNAQLTRQRADALIADKAIAQSEYDSRIAQASASTANVMALKQALASAKDRVTQSEARLGAARSKSAEVQANGPRQVETRKASVIFRQGALDLAQAQLKEAENNVGYTKIMAPINGIVGRKSVNIGDRVAPGQQLLAISQVDSLWVTANFRETQLRRIKVGDKAEVHVDSLGLELNGSVESIAGATGSRFSVLPPENATGNYVKVVQRLPVRIKLDPNQQGMDRLRPGMSVEPKVTVR